MKILTLETWNFILELIEKDIINNDNMTDKEKVDALWQKLNNLSRCFT